MLDPVQVHEVTAIQVKLTNALEQLQAERSEKARLAEIIAVLRSELELAKNSALKLTQEVRAAALPSRCSLLLCSTHCPLHRRSSKLLTDCVQRDELRVQVVRFETRVTQVNEELSKGRGSSNEYTLIIERLRAELRESNERFSVTSVEVKEIESLKRQRDHALEQLEAQHKQILDLTESIEIIRTEWKLERGKLLVEVRARSSAAARACAQLRLRWPAVLHDHECRSTTCARS